MNPTATAAYCPDLFSYQRRTAREVRVGHVALGGTNPVRIQSMITADTRDTAACVAEILALAEVGCEIVRLTAQTRIYAANLEHIARGVRAAGCTVPLVADIHFKPDAALEAAKWVEKVRINPGNYADKKKFAIREYSDAQYEEELDRIRDEFTPLVRLCKELGRAMRIGTNHGSLSDRIMNRYGDTPLGMVESALEFARIARAENYHDLVFSMKASNPKVMIEAYRLLVARLATEGPDWNYPIHLGVTEAGDGEDGRIKSAIGIGSLLEDGIGDTIRVSLTEDSVHEIPVAQELAALVNGGHASRPANLPATNILPAAWDPFSYARRSSVPLSVMGHLLGTGHPVRVAATSATWQSVAPRFALLGEFKPELVLEQSGVVELDPRDDAAVAALNASAEPRFVTVADATDLPVIAAFRLLAARVDPRHPVLLKDTLLGSESGCGFQPQVPLAATATVPASLQHDCQQPFIDPRRPIRKEHATYLPHWTQDGGIYAVTFRLADSIPVEVLASYQRSRERLIAEIDRISESGNPDPETLARLNHELAGLYDSSLGRVLDEGNGECHLRDPRVAELVATALRHFDGERYRLVAWCIMPNHVHLIIQPLDGHLLEDILHSIKSYTANAANRILGRSGVFWLKESYDHLIRHGEDYRNQLRYLLKNPEEARLGNWPWRDSIYGSTWEEAKSGSGRQLQEDPHLRLEAATTSASSDDFSATPPSAPCPTRALLAAATRIGSLLCDGIGDALIVRGEADPEAALRLSYNILQAAGTRIFKTDYVACPSCGRTLFNLQHTTQKIRAATGHLKGVRIAVMGCIVNGPGEMADADFGYVGGAPGKINLYVGKTPVSFNIPEDEAVTRLIELIREHGKWVDAPPA